MNLVLILSFAALVITIASCSSSSTNITRPFPPRSLVYNEVVQDRSWSFFRTIFSYIQSGISMILGSDERDSRGSGRRSEKNKIEYKRYQVIRIEPQSEEDVEVLENMPEEMEEIQFWTKPAKKAPTDILIPPGYIDDIRDYLREKGMGYEILIHDVQKLIEYENPKMTKDQRQILLARKGHPLTWSRYHRYGDMLRYAEFLVYAYPSLVELITIGYTSKGLPLKVIKISTEARGDLEPDEVKPAVWIDGGMHGREWITPAVVLYTVRQLVENYRKNKRLVDNADWYLLPVANPDGYEYSHTTDRLWAKTRSNHDNSAAAFTSNLIYGSCEGVNLNHNFDYHWGEAGSSDDPCSDYYAGPRAFSEPESKAISDFILDKRDQIQMYISLHSYSQQWLMPWSFSRRKVEDYEETLSMAKKAVQALEKVAGTHYGVGATINERAPSSGSSDEWVKGAVGVKYSYTVDLRDTGTYGYLLPATQILPTARETFVGIRAMAKSVVCKS